VLKASEVPASAPFNNVNKMAIGFDDLGTGTVDDVDNRRNCHQAPVQRIARS
jgi:hypothetical protein